MLKAEEARKIIMSIRKEEQTKKEKLAEEFCEKIANQKIKEAIQNKFKSTVVELNKTVEKDEVIRCLMRNGYSVRPGWDQGSISIGW